MRRRARHVEHTYQYTGGGAWHYNDDPMTPAKERTWSIWRGFEKVTHLTGVSDGTQSKTVTVYLRGMHGDRVLGADGKTPDADTRKTAEVSGIKAAAITDSDQYAGFTRETGHLQRRRPRSPGTINDPWSKRTATQHKSYADTEAYYVRPGATHARTNITSKLTPYDRVRTHQDHIRRLRHGRHRRRPGRPRRPPATRCAPAPGTPATPTGLQLPRISRTRAVAKPCSTADSALDLPEDSCRPGDVIADTATVYDDASATAWSAAQKPTKGDAIWTGRAKAYGSDDAPVLAEGRHDNLRQLGPPAM